MSRHMQFCDVTAIYRHTICGHGWPSLRRHTSLHDIHLKWRETLAFNPSLSQTLGQVPGGATQVPSYLRMQAVQTPLPPSGRAGHRDWTA